MDPKTSNRAKLYGLLGDRHGLVTLEMARDAGVPDVEVRKLAHRGALERVGKGVYRIPFAPVSKFEDAALALELVGEGSFISGESVLALLDIGLYNPRKIEVSTTNRIRTKLPGFIRVKPISSVAPFDVTSTQGVAHQSVFQALAELRASSDRQQYWRAATDAQKLGLLSSQQAKALLQG